MEYVINVNSLQDTLKRLVSYLQYKLKRLPDEKHNFQPK